MRRRRIRTLIDNPDGSVAAIDRAKLSEIPFHFVTNPPNTAVVVPSDQTSAPLIISVSGEGPAEIDTLAVQRTGTALVMMRIMDGNTPRAIMNGPVHLDNIFGSGRQPFVLPESLYIDEEQKLLITFTDQSGAQNTIRPALHASRYLKEIYDPNLIITRRRLRRRQYLSVPYFYTTNIAPVAIGAGLSVQATIDIGTDHHFDLWKISAVSTGRFSLQITDATTGEPLIEGFDGTAFPISSGLFIGDANFPWNLAEPRQYKKGTRLLLDFTDLSAAPNSVFLTLSGRMIADRMWRFPDDPVDATDTTE